jgi:galactokinase
MRVKNMLIKNLREQLNSGELDHILGVLYTDLSAARVRAAAVIEGWKNTFGGDDDAEVMLVSAPGRTELGGNHTDHQHGRVLCGSVDLDALACVGANGLHVIRVCSEGYGMAEASLDALEPSASEYGTSAALIRGVAAGMMEQGREVRGFDAYMVSNVPAGSGLSSSAAYEVLLGTIMDGLTGGGMDPVILAKIGQRAENVYFGKPCGLLDQTACAVGAASAVDFSNPAEPVVEAVDVDFAAHGYALCIIDTRSDHADLTDAYAAIPAEMKAVAACFGKEVLREVDEEEFLSGLARVRQQVGDRAVLRAMHFFAENRRAKEQAEALKKQDFEGYLKLVNQSGDSSWCLLQNISAGDPAHQAVALTLARGKQLLDGRGAIRVHGGGFAGTVQAYVPLDMLDEFRSGMEALLGEGVCHVVRIRPHGGFVIA